MVRAMTGQTTSGTSQAASDARTERRVRRETENVKKAELFVGGIGLGAALLWG